jgi:hypothetical protein
MNPLTQSKNTTIMPALIALTLAFIALPPQAREARAQCPEICSGFPQYLTALGNDALGQNTKGNYNTAVGAEALANNTTGGGNAAVGDFALSANISGYANTAMGDSALAANRGGYQNTAIGSGALFDNTEGRYNTAVGDSALQSNTTGIYNVAIGFAALDVNLTGLQNVAVGNGALLGNFSGNFNTAIGSNALYYSHDDQNTGVGWQAMYSFSSGSRNTAIGTQALRGDAVTRRLSTGMNNTATGARALYSDTSGSDNVAVGESALQSNTRGNRNIALGRGAGMNLTTGDNNIDIGNVGFAGESGIIRIGTAGTQTATFIAGIREAPLAHGVAVAVGITADGQLGVRASSARFKELVKPMDNASEAIFSLQPVTFRYKKDPAALPQFGLVAEEVAKVDPDLVARDVEGKPFTVRYDEINAMLLNEFLKEHRTVEELKKEIAALTATVKEQASQMQRVTSQLATGRVRLTGGLGIEKSSPQIVFNNQ